MNPFERYILYDAGGVVAVDKPAGLAATGRTLEDPDCMQYLAMQHYRRMVWAVHQLDTETSGVLVFVRKKSLVPVWQERLARPETFKRYLAIVHGRLDAGEVVVDAPIGEVPERTGRGQGGGRGRMRLRAGVRGGKPAHSVFRTLAVAERTGSGAVSLLEARITTGRTHQIRLHLEHLGLSLVGEKRYRAEPCTEHPRHALHAAAIELGDGFEPARITAPLPADMRALAEKLGLEIPGGT